MSKVFFKDDILNTIIENTPVGICITNEKGLYDFVNPAYCNIYGYIPEELIGKSFLTVVPEKNHEFMKQLHDEFLQSGAEVRGEWDVMDKSGRELSILADAVRVQDDSGLLYKVTFVIDITERRQMEKALKHARDSLEKQVELRTDELLKTNKNLNDAQRLAKIGSWEWLIPENKINWSDETYRIFGMEPGSFEATFEAYINAIHPDDRGKINKLIENTLKTKEAYLVEHRVVHPDGGILTVQGIGSVEADDSGNPARFYGTVQDITEKVAAEQQIRRLTTVLQESTSIIFITDSDGVIEYVNSRFEEITGYPAEQAVGQTPNLLTSGNLSQQEAKNIWETLAAGNSWRGQFRNRKINGEHFWVNAVISPIQDNSGTITNYLAIEEDITREKEAEDRAEYLSRYDGITGLYNRNTVLELLDERLDKGDALSLLIIDIDDFRFINENYGLRSGDEYLKALVESIEDYLEESGGSDYIFGRLGEDEFLLILDDAGERIGNDIRRVVKKLKIGSENIGTTVSLGIVRFPEHGRSAKDLLSRLDIALYRAKTGGKNRSHLFGPDDAGLSEVHTRFSQRRRIVDAIENDRFVIYFQPIQSLKDGQIHHFEVLVRMKDSDGSILLPGSFIPAAESFGLVGAIDRIVAEKTISFQAELAGKGIHLSFSMNLSGKDLADKDLLNFLKEQITRSGAEPENIVFEITETSAIEDLSRAVEFITRLKTLGCKFSLDDFGVGFTSFVYLRELNVDFIKIDGAFVRSLSSKRNDQTIVKAISFVARDMGIESIAEFVQTEVDMKLLEDLGVDFVQGYLIGKPDADPLRFLKTR